MNLSFSSLAVIFIFGVSLAAYINNWWLALLPFSVLIFQFGWQKKEYIFWLLLLSIPFSFEFKFTDTLGTDLPDEMLMLFVSFLFLAGWIYYPGSLDKKKLNHPLIILTLISLLWILVSALFAGNALLSLKFLLAKTWYTGAFLLAPLILLNNKQRIIATAVLLTAAMLIVILISLYKHQQSGFSFASINDAVHPFFRNHVNYSAMLVCLIPLGVALFFFSKNKPYRYYILLAVILSVAALILSYSRGAWLALITGAIAWWLTRKRLLFTFYLFFIGSCLVALFWLRSKDNYLHYAHDYRTTIFHKDFGEHLVSTYKLKDVSTAERFYRWIAGARMIKDNWLTGYGPNNFYNYYKGYTVPAYKTWVSDNKEHSTIHNYFLLVAVEQGLPGLLFLIILFGAILYYAQLLYHRIKDPFYRNCSLVIGVVTSMIITVNFLSDLIETDKIGSLFFLSIALLVNISKPSSNIKGIS